MVVVTTASQALNNVLQVVRSTSRESNSKPRPLNDEPDALTVTAKASSDANLHY